jgi:hypothetical protein
MLLPGMKQEEFGSWTRPFLNAIAKFGGECDILP